MDNPVRGRQAFTLTRTLSSSSPALEASSHLGTSSASLERRRLHGEAPSGPSSNAEDRDSSPYRAPQRPPLWTSNSHSGAYQNLTSRQPSPNGLNSNGHVYKKSGGGSFAQSRGYDGAPPLHIRVTGNPGDPPRLNTARLGPSTPLWTGLGNPSTPGIFPPTTLATGVVARRAFRSRASLLSGIALCMLVFSMYFTTFHPEASGALIKSATAPLESAANAAKAVIKGGGATGADMEEESWSDLLGFGGDLLDINSWGLLNSGRDKDGNLPLSPWNRYKETWNRHREDALLHHVVPNRHDGVSHHICSFRRVRTDVCSSSFSAY